METLIVKAKKPCNLGVLVIGGDLIYFTEAGQEREVPDVPLVERYAESGFLEIVRRGTTAAPVAAPKPEKKPEPEKKSKK